MSLRASAHELSVRRALREGYSPSERHHGLVAIDCNPRNQKAKAGRLRIQGQPWLSDECTVTPVVHENL